MPFPSGVKARGCQIHFQLTVEKSRQDRGGRISLVCLQGFNSFPARHPEGSRSPPSPRVGHFILAWSPSTMLGPELGVLGSPCPRESLQVPAREGTKHQSIPMAQPRHVNYSYSFLFSLSFSFFLILTLILILYFYKENFYFLRSTLEET